MAKCFSTKNQLLHLSRRARFLVYGYTVQPIEFYLHQLRVDFEQPTYEGNKCILKNTETGELLKNERGGDVFRENYILPELISTLESNIFMFRGVKVEKCGYKRI